MTHPHAGFCDRHRRLFDPACLCGEDSDYCASGPCAALTRQWDARGLASLLVFLTCADCLEAMAALVRKAHEGMGALIRSCVAPDSEREP